MHNNINSLKSWFNPEIVDLDADTDSIEKKSAMVGDGSKAQTS